MSAGETMEGGLILNHDELPHIQYLGPYMDLVQTHRKLMKSMFVAPFEKSLEQIVAEDEDQRCIAI